MLSFLDGYKTYIAAAVAGALAVANALGVAIPEWALLALSSLGLYGVRSAVTKVETK